MFFIYSVLHMSTLYKKNGEQACNYSILVHRGISTSDVFLSFNNFNDLGFRLFTLR